MLSLSSNTPKPIFQSLFEYGRSFCCYLTAVFVTLLFLQAPSFPNTDLQTPSSRSLSGSVTSTAVSTPSFTRAPTRSTRKLSKVYSGFNVWERPPGRTTIIWVQLRVKARVTVSNSLWDWTAGGRPVGSAHPPPWPCPERPPPGTAGSGVSSPGVPQVDRDQPGRGGTRWPNSAVKASIGPAAAFSALGFPRRSRTPPKRLRSETFPPLKSTNCPCQKKESLYSHYNPSSISH